MAAVSKYYLITLPPWLLQSDMYESKDRFVVILTEVAMVMEHCINNDHDDDGWAFKHGNLESQCLKGNLL